MADQIKTAIRAAARAWSDRSSDTCGVNREDNWKTYSEEFVADTEAVLAAYFAAAPAVPAVDALTRYAPTADVCQNEAIADMDLDTDGEYVKLADVQALLATPSTAPAQLNEQQVADILLQFGLVTKLGYSALRSGDLLEAPLEYLTRFANVVRSSTAPDEQKQQPQPLEATSEQMGGAQVAKAEPVELAGVREQMDVGAGFWHSCSGCHETEDGHSVGNYAYSNMMRCLLGNGCSECGGIGAVWDNNDYEAMAKDWDEDAAPTTESAAAPADQQCAELQRAAEYLEHYAKYLYEVKLEDIERHPYIPAIEEAAADLRAMIAGAQAAQPDQGETK